MPARRNWSNLPFWGVCLFVCYWVGIIRAGESAKPLVDAVAQSATATSSPLMSAQSPTVDCSSLIALPICPSQREIDAVMQINKHRSDSGRVPLVWDYRLFIATRCHSTDMAVNGCFQHDDCDGTSWTAKYVAQGYGGIRGQHIAASYTSGVSVADAWFGASDLHRQVMLEPSTRHVAVGYFAGGSYNHYWTAAYGTVASVQTLPCSCCSGLTGNVDCDPSDGVDISDLSALIDNLYISFTPLCCPAEANTDGQPGTDISDLSALIDFLYITFTPTAACQ